jgi:hypothetical protein
LFRIWSIAAVKSRLSLRQDQALYYPISSIELIKVNGQGPNALDIFIAFYLGKYFNSIKNSEIIIFSKDSDYDQLIKHLT